MSLSVSIRLSVSACMRTALRGERRAPRHVLLRASEQRAPWYTQDTRRTLGRAGHGAGPWHSETVTWTHYSHGLVMRLAYSLLYVTCLVIKAHVIKVTCLVIKALRVSCYAPSHGLVMPRPCAMSCCMPCQRCCACLVIRRKMRLYKVAHDSNLNMNEMGGCWGGLVPGLVIPCSGYLR